MKHKKVLAIAAGSLALVLIFPRIAQFIEGAAYGVIRFWWVALIVALLAWIFWVAKDNTKQ